MTKILIIQTAFIGDVILATALIEKISQHIPNAQLDFLVKKGNEHLLKNNPHINKIIVLDKAKKYSSLFLLIKNIRQQCYDKVINVQRHFTTGLITALSGAKETIGFDKNPLAFLFTKKVCHSFNNVHEVERNQGLIKHFTDTLHAMPKVYYSKADAEKSEKFISTKYITISAGSIWATKKYPIDKWKDFLNAIDPIYKVYFLGSKAETEEAEMIIQGSEKANGINLCGQLNLLESAAFMKHAQMNYCNDSAPTHIASALGAPVATLFCSTSPKYGFAPISHQSFIIETLLSMPCKPCGIHGKKKCPLQHFNCANTITKNQLLACL